MVFIMSRAQAPVLQCGPQWEPAARFHRATVHYQLSIPAHETRDALNATLDEALICGRLPFARSKNKEWLLKFSDVLQFLSIVDVSIDDASVLRIVSTSACVVPAWVPFGFLLQWLLVWLPFLDLGHNLAVTRTLYQNLARENHTVFKAECGPEIVIERGGGGSFSESRLLGAVSAQSKFFLAFIATPVGILAYLFATSGIVQW